MYICVENNLAKAVQLQHLIIITIVIIIVIIIIINKQVLLQSVISFYDFTLKNKSVIKLKNNSTQF